MYAISSGISRVLIATSTAPARGTPKCASSSSWTLGARNATRSPCSMPLAWSARASRRTRSRTSAQVKRRSPSTTAVLLGKTSEVRSRNASGVSGECETPFTSQATPSGRGVDNRYPLLSAFGLPRCGPIASRERAAFIRKSFLSADGVPSRGDHVEIVIPCGSSEREPIYEEQLQDNRCKQGTSCGRGRDGRDGGCRWRDLRQLGRRLECR